ADSNSITPQEDYEDVSQLTGIIFDRVRKAIPDMVRMLVPEQLSASKVKVKSTDYSHLNYDRRPMREYSIDHLDQQLVQSLLAKPLSQEAARSAGVTQPTSAEHLKLLGCLHPDGPTVGVFLACAPRSLLVDKLDACSLHMGAYEGKFR